MKDNDIKRSIIGYFREKGSNPVSGEDISRELGFSRANLWKYIKKLREEGYIIDAAPRVGYRLTAVPDEITPYEVDPGPGTRVFGKTDIHCFKSLTSTNVEAYCLAETGAPEGTLVIAETQTEGKGRMGRKWVSPAGGGIYMSVILRPRVPLDRVSPMALVAAGAVARTIKMETGIEPSVKWPNDVMISDKKISGILTEIKAQPDMVDFMVLGIGINVNTAKSELPPEGTSLAEEVGGWLDRTVFLRAFMGELEKDYFLLLKEGFGVFRDSLRSVSSVIGRHIKIRRGKSLVYAEALDIDEIGALVLRFEDGTVRSVYSGDVSIAAR